MEKRCVEEVRDLVETAENEGRSKKQKQDFSRKRKMPFKKLMWFMFSVVKECARNALERLFPKIAYIFPLMLIAPPVDRVFYICFFGLINLLGALDTSVAPVSRVVLGVPSLIFSW